MLIARTRFQAPGPTAIALLALLALLESQPALGKKLYKYQDANGAWSFTDRPPATGVPVEISQLAVRDLPARISIRNGGTPETPVLAAINDYYGPVEVEISAEALKNMRAEPTATRAGGRPGPHGTHGGHAQANRHALELRLQVRAVLGDPAATHRPSSPTRHRSRQGNGSASAKHSTVASATNIRRAVTRWISACRWALRCAPRGPGPSWKMAGDFFDGGTDPKYQSRANAVRVLHDDGTMAVYAHLHRLDSGGTGAAGETRHLAGQLR
ncbi:MAG: hypothetical protein R3F44_04245 [Candidatus Competibacteraceae bacterium]